METKKLCACGCRREIIIQKYHQWRPSKYILGHHWKGKIQSEEHIKKRTINISEIQKKQFKEGKRISPMKGKHHSEETKKKISERGKGKNLGNQNGFKKGQISWNKNKKNCFSRETIEKIRQARFNQVLPLKDTFIETLIQNKLKELNIKFVIHSNINNIAQPDIFIEPNICIFIDGCYWHGCEQCFDKNKMSEWVKTRKIKDILITQKLIEENYVVLRLWEHDIKKNTDLCLLQIKEKLNLIIGGIK